MRSCASIASRPSATSSASTPNPNAFGATSAASAARSPFASATRCAWTIAVDRLRPAREQPATRAAPRPSHGARCAAASAGIDRARPGARRSSALVAVGFSVVVGRSRARRRSGRATLLLRSTTPARRCRRRSRSRTRRARSTCRRRDRRLVGGDRGMPPHRAARARRPDGGGKPRAVELASRSSVSRCASSACSEAPAGSRPGTARTTHEHRRCRSPISASAISVDVAGRQDAQDQRSVVVVDREQHDAEHRVEQRAADAG